MDAIPYIDELINEYLLFRGFVKSFTHFNTEKQVQTLPSPGQSGSGNTGTGGAAPREQALNIPADVDTLAELLLGHVRALELAELCEVWATLRSKFFIHLDSGNGVAQGSFEPVIRAMEMALKKAVLVKAHSRKRMDKMRECFDTLQGEMVAATAATNGAVGTTALEGGTWDGWFALPYVSDPTTHPLFGPYFHRKWFATVSASLRNFLATLFRVLPLPRILAFNLERDKRRKATTEIRQLRSELERTKAELAAATSELAKMKNNGYRIFGNARQQASSSHTDSLPLTPPSNASWAEGRAAAPSSAASTTGLAGPAASIALEVHEDHTADAPRFALSSSSILTLSAAPTSALFSLASTHVLLGHGGPVLKARFNSEGTVLATMSNNALDLDQATLGPSHPEERAQTKLWNLEAMLEARAEAQAREDEEADRAERDAEALASPKLAPSPHSFRTEEGSPRSSHKPSSRASVSTSSQGQRSSFVSPLDPARTASASPSASARGIDADSSTSSFFVPSSSSDGNADEQLHPFIGLSHGTPLSTIAWSKSDAYLLTGSASDGRIGVWNLASAGSPKLMTEFCSSDSPLGACPVVLDLVASPGDRFLVAASASKMHCECGPTNSAASVGELHGVLESYDLTTGKRDVQFQASGAGAGLGAAKGLGRECSQVNSIALSHNANLLVSGGADGMIRVWDTRTSQAMLGWSAHTLAAVSCLRLCADETTVLSCGLDGSISEWSLHRMGKVMRELRMPSPPLRLPSAGGSFSSSTQFLARPEFALDGFTKHALLSEGFGWRPCDADSSTQKPCAYLYELGRSEPVQALQGHAGPVLSVDWHPAASVLATASLDHTARLVTVKGQRPQQTQR